MTAGMKILAAPLLTALLLLPGGRGLAIVDGDTLDIAGERIRIANIDAPEIHQAKCPDEKARGLEAKARLRQLVTGALLAISRGDPQDGRLKDWRGRTLALIVVDGRDVGQVLIEEGLARPWTGKRLPWCGVPL